MLTVACVYKPGSGFSDEYVYRLRDGYREFCRVDHRFLCLTDRKIKGVECAAPQRNWRGWWNKLELFRKGLFDGPVMYCDLDAMIVGDITDIAEARYPFACLTNWKGNMRDTINSSFMLWDGTLDLSTVVEDFDENYDRYEQDWTLWGDQGRIQEALPIPFYPLEEDFPRRVLSYKIHIRRPGFVPKGTSIVMFHGKPRPHEVNWTLPNGNRN